MIKKTQNAQKMVAGRERGREAGWGRERKRKWVPHRFGRLFDDCSLALFGKDHEFWLKWKITSEKNCLSIVCTFVKKKWDCKIKTKESKTKKNLWWQKETNKSKEEQLEMNTSAQDWQIIRSQKHQNEKGKKDLGKCNKMFRYLVIKKQDQLNWSN